MSFHLYSLWGATLIPLRACAMDWGRKWNRIPMTGKISGPVLSCLFSDNVGDLLYFPTPLPDCLRHASFRRYSPLSLDVVENTTRSMQLLAPSFFSRGRPQLLRHSVSTIFPTVWRSLIAFCLLTSVCDGWQRSRGWGNDGRIVSRL